VRTWDSWGLVGVQKRIEREVVKDRSKMLLTRNWRQELERRRGGESMEQAVSVARFIERFAGALV
jgi:hypothetical protein